MWFIKRDEFIISDAVASFDKQLMRFFLRRSSFQESLRFRKKFYRSFIAQLINIEKKLKTLKKTIIKLIGKMSKYE